MSNTATTAATTETGKSEPVAEGVVDVVVSAIKDVVDVILIFKGTVIIVRVPVVRGSMNSVLVL